MLINHQTTWGQVDELNIEPCGLARIHGWSLDLSAKLPAPRLFAGSTEVPLLHRYRYYRPDVGIDQPLAGVAFEYQLPLSTRFVRVDMGSDGNREFPVSALYQADYGGLLGERRVLKRHEIYGFGPPTPVISDDVRRLMPLMQGRTLDFGCGAGALVAELRTRDTDAYGLELDRPLIRDHLRHDIAPYIALYDGGKAPFPDNHFDCVTSFEVIEHINDYEFSLAEIARLAPMAIFSVPDIAVIPLCHRHNVVPWHLLEATHVNFFTETSFREALAKHYSDIEFGRASPVSINGMTFYISLLAICRR